MSGETHASGAVDRGHDPAWKLITWPLFGILAMAAFVLGFVGFHSYFVGERNTTDVAYLALQLFTLESGSVPQTGTPWQLEIARILAPATTAIALGAALVAVFRSEITEIRLRLTKDHIIVCGLGNLGSRLVDALNDNGYRVVAIERDHATPAIEEARDRGMFVVTGDARHVDVLHRAGAGRAQAIVALTGSDDANAEIAIRAGEIAARRKGAGLTCFAHIGDPDLSTLLTAEELSTWHDAGYRLEYVNVETRGARGLLTDHPPSARDGPVHIVVVGLNPLGRALVGEAARQWLLRSPPGDTRLTITIVDEGATVFCGRMAARSPSLETAVRLEAVDQAADDYAFTGPFNEHCNAVYVCTDDNALALEVAFNLHRRIRRDDAPIVVELTQSAGLARLVDRLSGNRRLHVFDLFARSLRPDVLFGGTHEILARAIHQEYLRENLAAGAMVAATPSLQPWDALPDSLKESNRDQAAHIGIKVAAIGCQVVPVTGCEDEEFRFAESEVERLAKMEHDRWTQQRLRDGWKLGPKDTENKSSPYLVPWSRLDEDIREWDRRAVRALPGFLLRAGFQIRRVEVASDLYRSISITPG